MEPSEIVTNPQELDRTENKFTEACNTAFKVACPTGKPRGRKKTPWWTQQQSILRTNCRCLLKRAKAGNEGTNWQNYKYELASYKKAIRRAKRTALQTFCSDIGSGKYSLRQPRLWAIFRKQMDHGQTPVKSPWTCS